MQDLPEKSIGLCLSGGGFRASLYHLGVLRYLAESGQLANVSTLSCVSGGSIIGAYLAVKWEALRGRNFSLDAFMEEVYDPFVKRVSSGNFRNRWLVQCLLTIPLLPWPNFTWSILWSRLFDAWFYGDEKITLHDLPDDLDVVFNAANLASAQGYRLGRNYYGDDKGYLEWSANGNGSVRLSDVVTTSAAHLPMSLVFSNGDRLWFMDGGVYDNTGLDWYLNATSRRRPPAARKPEFLIVSDASPELLEWDWNWRRYIPLYRMFGVLGRVSSILQEQTRRTRKDRFIERIRDLKTNIGIIISIDVNGSELRELKQMDNSQLLKAAALPQSVVNRIRAMRTDLNQFMDVEAELLAYHGYSLAHIYLNVFQKEVCVGGRLTFVEDQPCWQIDLSEAAVGRYVERLASCHKRFDRARRWF